MKNKKKIITYVVATILIILIVPIIWQMIIDKPAFNSCHSICPNSEYDDIIAGKFCKCSNGMIINANTFEVVIHRNESE